MMRAKAFPLGALVLVAIALLVVACGSPAAAPAPTAAPAQPAGASAGQPTAAPAKAAAPTVTLKFAHHNPAAGYLHTAFMDYADSINKATGGSVKAQIYAAETLAKGSDMVPAVQTGVADMGWAVMGMFPGQFPLTEAYMLPLMGQKSSTAGSQAMNDWFQNSPELQKEWSSLKLLGFTSSAPQWVMTGKKPVRTFEDVKGLKLRIAGWGGTELLKAVGASPVNMAPPEMYDSVAKGIIDGAVFDWMGGDDFKLWEVINYATTFPIVFQAQALVMNKAKWDSLTPDQQKAITSVSGETAGKLLGAAFDRSDVEVSAKFKGLPGKEIISISPDDQAKWRNAAKPVWDAWVKQVAGKGLDGQKAIEGLQTAIAKYNK